MKTKDKGAKYSAIVGIGEKIKKIEVETNEEYLKLNRGVNMVINMDLSKVIPQIDFNSDEIQVYPPNSGIFSLRKAINDDYFNSQSSEDNIFVVNGGMSGLDLIMKTLDIKKLYHSEFYWGAYKNIMKINDIEQGTYPSYESIYDNLEDYKGNALIICDPNNPIGNKYSDEKLLDIIKVLSDNDVTVIIDCPYRRLFIDDNSFYIKLLELDNVIINESFSKRMSLSGQRIGFVHSKNKEFNNMLNINILFSTNGINAFSQVLIQRILTTKEGIESMEHFKTMTKEHIMNNIKYLIDNNLLADEFYTNSVPMGIFVIVKPSSEKLLSHKIGSVSLSYFTPNQEVINKNYSRICVSVDHSKFVKYFDEILND